MSVDFFNAIWLARRQMLDQWPSFVMTAAYFAFMGAVLAADDSYTRDFVQPIMMLILIQPALSSRYMTFKQDNDVVRHQVFLRTLPLPVRTTIIARAVAMLAAGSINVPLYFVMFWILGEFGLSVAQFLSWVIFWVGIALVGTGISLIQEFKLDIRRWTAMNLTLVVLIFLLIPFLIWVVDFRPFSWSVRAAAENPLMMAFIGFMLGVTSLIGSVLVAERLYRKREFVT